MAILRFIKSFIISPYRRYIPSSDPATTMNTVCGAGAICGVAVCGYS